MIKVKTDLIMILRIISKVIWWEYYVKKLNDVTH